MPAPSKSFTVIPDADIDPDSPITTGLMTNFRDNDIFLQEWLGKTAFDADNAAQDHNHDGVNSAQISLSFSTGSGTSYSVSSPTGSTALWVELQGYAFNSDELASIVGSIVFDLSAFTLTGVGRIATDNAEVAPSPGGVVTDHAATAIADNVFVTVVTLTTTLTATLQIRYNRGTDVFDIRVTDNGAARDVGMRVLEV